MSDATAEERISARIARHRAAGAALDSLNDEELCNWLVQSTVPTGIRVLPNRDAQVFVKQIPISAIELAHRESTANYFGLPVYYHYRLGSCGFGAWRELAVHRTANEWALSGVCTQVTLLHGWRVLPISNPTPDDKAALDPWGDNAAIRRRVHAYRSATESLVLFLEPTQHTLLDWMRDAKTDLTSLDVEVALDHLLASVNGAEVLHLDAHFENILTDGTQLFLTDHGLALSTAFDLDADERQFFADHQNFDRCTVITSLMHALVSRYAPNAPWRETLRAILDTTHPHVGAIPLAVRSVLARYEPVAGAIGDFYERLTVDLCTPYPAHEIDVLLDAAG